MSGPALLCPLQFPFVGRGFSVRDIPGLALWLDASDKDTLFTDASLTTPCSADFDPVGGWKDKSGNLAHATQSVSGQRPSYRAAQGLRGTSMVSFDGVDDQLTLGGPAGDLIRNRAGFTVLVVADNTSAAVVHTFFYASTTSASTTRLSLARNASTQLGVFGRRLDGDSGQSVSGGSGLANRLYVLTAHLSYSTDTVKTLQDGLLLASTNSFQSASSGQPTSNTSSAAVRIGSGGGGTLAGRIAEVVAFTRALTDGERTSMERYLAQKWGVPL